MDRLRRLAALGGEALDLVLPRVCAGCGVETVSLCADCLASMSPDPVTVVPRYGLLPVTGAGAYSGPLRESVIALKDKRRRDLLPVLDILLAAALGAALTDREYTGGPVAAVPVPSSRSAVRRRGADLVAGLSRRACTMLSDDGLDIVSAQPLRVAGHTDQVGSGVRDRRRNVRGTHSVGSGPAARQALRAVAAAQVVVLVDDVLTTGATLAEAARALAAAGVEADCCAVLALTDDGRSAEAPS